MTVVPGETVPVPVTVTAANVDRLPFGVPFLDSDALTVESFDVSPAADVTLESYPPVWRWDGPQSSVEATMTSGPPRTRRRRPSPTASPPRVDTEVTEEFEIAVGTPSG